MKPSTAINLDDDIENIISFFEDTNQTILPVIKNQKFYGLLSKNKILEHYRLVFKNLVID